MHEDFGGPKRGEWAERALKQRRASVASIKINITGTFCRRANRITQFHSPYFVVAPRASRSVQFVMAVSFSPNGEMLASGGGDGKINVYSVADNFSRMYTLEGHTHWLSTLSFSPSSTRLVSGSFDKSIRLWNATEGTLLETVDKAHTNIILAVAHSPNGDLIASGSQQSTIKIWDAKTLKLKFAINDAHPNSVNDFSFAPTGPFLLSASKDTTVKVIKIALLDSYVKRSSVLLAYLRFAENVNTIEGSEAQNSKRPAAPTPPNSRAGCCSAA